MAKHLRTSQGDPHVSTAGFAEPARHMRGSSAAVTTRLERISAADPVVAADSVVAVEEPEDPGTEIGRAHV